MITITHTHADGTLIDGSVKGDGVFEILKGLRTSWRYFPSIGRIGLGQSRDRAAKTWHIERAAEALRAAGHEVTVTIDEDQRRDFATAEAERYERAQDRAGRMAGYAANASQRSAAAFAQVDQIMDMIPMGQPVLVGHHSERRHRKDLERIERGITRGVEESRKTEHYQHRAQNAETYQAAREDVPTTLRRIKKLEAEQRGVKADLAGRVEYYQNDAGEWKCRLVKPEGDHLARLQVRAADLADELAHWRGVVERAQAAGVKVWGRGDFQRGDFVKGAHGWLEVLRVNAKSLTVPGGPDIKPVVTGANRAYSWNDTLPYDKVTGRKSADEMAAILAEADRREAEQASA